jgi:hypothetical protein
LDYLGQNSIADLAKALESKRRTLEKTKRVKKVLAAKRV